MIKTLTKSIREFKKETILAPVLVTVEVVMECLIPLYMVTMLERIQQDNSIENILFWGGILLVMALVSLVFGMLAGRYAAKASAGFSRNLRTDIYASIQGFSFANIDKFSPSSLVTRMTTDVTNIQNAFMMIIRIAVRSPIMLVVSVVMAFTINWKIALVFLALVPVLGVGLFLIFRKVDPIFAKVFKKYDAMNESIQENIKGIRVVKSYVREDYEIKKFGKTAQDVRADFQRGEMIMALNSPLMQFAIWTAISIVCIFGSQLIVQSSGAELNEASLSSLIAYGAQIMSALMTLSMVMVMISIATSSSERVAEVLSEKSTLTNPENPVYEVPDGSVEFRDVSFKYSAKAERFALQDVNLTIKPGQTVGILGGTGSSKTSLVNLIPRLYDVSEGEVLVGGIDVRDYDLESLRNQVSVVLQKNVLFSGTIKENLRWGNPDATDEELVEACKRAQAHEFVSSFPDGYDTYIEQGGTNVSGGQKQRLCIARALLKKPKILILDDSTSAVDTKTDALIRQAFREELPDVTKFIIAQRVSSVEDADLIVIMDGGKVVATGTHEQLLAGNKIYQEVYYSQNRMGASAAELNDIRKSGAGAAEDGGSAEGGEE
ncbi:MAG TPA: ABC transporter ATP-binding protein [Candidatus Limadaptatus stercoravium]|nr:ABC transporter ATP-binding protein [Candidatus Limadaptatus stercoravium]